MKRHVSSKAHSETVGNTSCKSGLFGQKTKETATFPPYADKLRTIKKLDSSILKITPACSLRELETYKHEMNRLLDFLEQEKTELDALAESLTSSTAPAALNLSEEIDKLKAEALLTSVETELQMDALLVSEEEGRLERGLQKLYQCYRRYNQSLDHLFKKCGDYKQSLAGITSVLEK